MPYEFYKYLHILGIVATVYSFGIMFLRSTGEDKRKWPMAINGIGLFLILLGGFGMAARLGLTSSFPAWIWIKVAIWILLAATPMVLRKMSSSPQVAAIVQIGLIALSSYFGIFKI